MKSSFIAASFAVIAIGLSGCASIVSKSNWPVQLSSTPPGAMVTVKDASGSEIYRGTTPTQVTLKSGRGYFKSGSYTLEFSKDGVRPQTVQLKAGVNGWYIGNLVFGGLLGLLVVDPLTGAMYRFDESVNVTLSPLAANLEQGDLRVVSLADVPASERAALVRLN
jgi:hypothetical protein